MGLFAIWIHSHLAADDVNVCIDARVRKLVRDLRLAPVISAQEKADEKQHSYALV